jgi:hypothetical protein
MYYKLFVTQKRKFLSNKIIYENSYDTLHEALQASADFKENFKVKVYTDIERIEDDKTRYN